MPIKFLCPHCQRKLRVPDDSANQEGACSFCHKTLTIPATSTIPDSPRAPGAPVDKAVATGTATDPKDAPPPKTAPALPVVPKEKPASARAAAPAAPTTAAAPAVGFIKFTCPNCSKPTGFPAAMANEAVTCPSCQMQIMCPDRSGGESFLIGGAGKKSFRAPAPIRKSAPSVPTVPASMPVEEPKKSNLVLWVATAAVVFVAIGLGLVIGLGVFRKKETVTKTETVPAAEKEKNVAAMAPSHTPPVPETKTDAPKAPSDADKIWVAMEERIDKLNKDGKRDEAIKACTDLPPEILAQLKPDITAILKERGEKKAALLRAEAPVVQVATATEPKSDAPQTAQPAPVQTAEPEVKAPVAPTDQELGSLIAGTKPKKNAQEEETVADETKNLTIKPAQREVNPLLGETKDAPKETASAKPVTPAPPAKPVIPQAALDVCADCLGTRFLPFFPPHTYAWTDGDATPKPDACLPWRACPKCNKEFDANLLVSAETDRLARADQIKPIWDTVFGSKVARAETAYVTVITQAPPSFARPIIASLSKLTTHLQTVTKNTVLTQTRPDSHFMIMANGDPGWKKLYDNWAKERTSIAEKDFLRVGGTNSRNLSISHPESNRVLEAQHFAIFQFGHMLMKEAANGKAPPWLEEGFAAYCENQMFEKNLCYSFAYERNEVKFQDNWNAEIKNYALKGQLKTWDKMFNITMENLKALDYLTCYSMVAFFIRNEPQKFTRFVQLVRDGVDAPVALEKVFNKKVSELQMMWAQWAVTQR